MLKNISTKFVNNLQRLIKKKKKFSQSNKLSFKQSILKKSYYEIFKIVYDSFLTIYYFKLYTIREWKRDRVATCWNGVT